MTPYGISSDATRGHGLDGVDAFVFDDEPLIVSVRAFWDRDARTRTRRRP